MEHKITVASPHAKSPNPGRFAQDPYYQHLLLNQAVRQVLLDPFEQSRDLRGAAIRVTLHDDGLHATAEIISNEERDGYEALFHHAQHILGSNRRIRRTEDVELPD